MAFLALLIVLKHSVVMEQTKKIQRRTTAGKC